MANRNIRIRIQPWLWSTALIFLVAISLTCLLLRFLPSGLRYEGRVQELSSGAPIAGAFVEVAWFQANQSRFPTQASRSPVWRQVVRTDAQGRYQVQWPAQLSHAVGPEPLFVETLRVYKPGFRHLQLQSSGVQLPERLIPTTRVWNGGWLPAEIDMADRRDRTGQVRLVAVEGSASQRLRQLYLVADSLTPPLAKEGSVEQAWLQALCQEADQLQLDADEDLSLREELCAQPEQARIAMQSLHPTLTL